MTSIKGKVYKLSPGEITLEYSEKQGHFHYGTGKYPVDTNGYLTICKHISQDQASEFVKTMIDKYHNTKDQYGGLMDTNKHPPTTNLIMMEFAFFLFTDPVL